MYWILAKNLKLLKNIQEKITWRVTSTSNKSSIQRDCIIICCYFDNSKNCAFQSYRRFINSPDGKSLLSLLWNLSPERLVRNIFWVSVRSIGKRVTSYEGWISFYFTVENLQYHYIHVFIRKKFVSKKQSMKTLKNFKEIFKNLKYYNWYCKKLLQFLEKLNWFIMQ